MFDRTRMSYVALDVFCLFLASLPTIVLNLGNVSPLHTGFFCTHNLRYPYYENPISAKALVGLGICLPIICLSVGESLSVYYDLLYSNSFIKNNYVATIYKAVGTFLFGAAINQSSTAITQYTVSRLRPYFLAVCDPDVRKFNCSRGFTVNYTCRGDPQKVKEARLSFYSGYAAYSMYCAMFVALYIESRLRAEWARLFRTTLQFGLLSISFCVGIFQGSYYISRWSDVYTGFAVGAGIAIFVIIHVSHFFNDRKEGAPSTANTAYNRGPQTEAKTVK